MRSLAEPMVIMVSEIFMLGKQDKHTNIHQEVDSHTGIPHLREDMDTDSEPALRSGCAK